MGISWRWNKEKSKVLRPGRSKSVALVYIMEANWLKDCLAAKDLGLLAAKKASNMVTYIRQSVMSR